MVFAGAPPAARLVMASLMANTIAASFVDSLQVVLNVVPASIALQQTKTMQIVDTLRGRVMSVFFMSLPGLSVLFAILAASINMNPTKSIDDWLTEAIGHVFLIATCLYSFLLIMILAVRHLCILTLTEFAQIQQTTKEMDVESIDMSTAKSSVKPTLSAVSQKSTKPNKTGNPSLKRRASGRTIRQEKLSFDQQLGTVMFVTTHNGILASIMIMSFAYYLFTLPYQASNVYLTIPTIFLCDIYPGFSGAAAAISYRKSVKKLTWEKSISRQVSKVRSNSQTNSTADSTMSNEGPKEVIIERRPSVPKPTTAANANFM